MRRPPIPIIGATSPLQRAIGVHHVLLQAGVDPPTPAVLPYQFVQSIERILIPTRKVPVLPVGTKVRVLTGAFDQTWTVGEGTDLVTD